MSASTRRTIGVLSVPLLLVPVSGLHVRWGVRAFLAPSQGGSGAVSLDTPTQLASVSLPGQPSLLAWSADGSYLAAGTAGLAVGETVPGAVYVVDVAKASVLTTLEVKSGVEGL